MVHCEFTANVTQKSVCCESLIKSEVNGGAWYASSAAAEGI